MDHHESHHVVEKYKLIYGETRMVMACSLCGAEGDYLLAPCPKNIKLEDE